MYKKGDVLLRIDPTPYQNAVDRLQAKILADDSAVENAKASARQLSESLRGAAGQVAVVESKISLAQRRLAENEELVANGAGDLFALGYAACAAGSLCLDPDGGHGFVHTVVLSKAGELVAADFQNDQSPSFQRRPPRQLADAEQLAVARLRELLR